MSTTELLYWHCPSCNAAMRAAKPEPREWTARVACSQCGATSRVLGVAFPDVETPGIITAATHDARQAALAARWEASEQ